VTSFPITTAVVDQEYVYQLAATDNCSGAQTFAYSLTQGPAGMSIDASGRTTWTPTMAEIGMHTVRVRVEPSGPRLCPRATQVFSVEVVNPPEAPEMVAPPVSEMVPTSFGDSTSFLYDGRSGIQTGVNPRDIDMARVAVLRGVVQERGTRIPIAGVRVSVLDHPEFGETLTRTDGAFDLAVNGGAGLALCFEHGGYLECQRQVEIPPQDYVPVDTVMLVPIDPAVTELTLSEIEGCAVAQGGVVTDADGSRQATVLFPEGTEAKLVMPGGRELSINMINVRATEYTVGQDGPESMPGSLPDTSGYTYAVELSLDEAILAGAESVEFSQPLPFYVENFIDFDAGTIVPSGFYDRARGAWMPSKNGLVIGILSVTNGMADLDLDGSGLPADAAALQNLGITDVERMELASLYAPGTELWRVPIEHFTPWDCNWPYGPPPDAESPDVPEPEYGDEEGDDACGQGSVIRFESQVIGEIVPVAGTPYNLVYSSDRVEGFQPNRTIRVKASPDTLPSGVESIEIEVYVAGKTTKASLPPIPNQEWLFVWDGLDAYGRPVVGGQKATVRLGYMYEAFYYESRSDWEQSFGSSSGNITGNRARRSVTLWRNYRSSDTQGFHRWDQKSTELGGWGFNVHHRYDPKQRLMYLGGGATVSAAAMPGNDVIETVAGTGVYGFSGDGGPASAAQLSSVQGIDIGPDESIYIADTENQRVRRIDNTGIITTVAGNGVPGFGGDGGPATAASLFLPTDIACAPDGSLYIADGFNRRVRRVDPNGDISTIAGLGFPFVSGGDGGPATDARFVDVWSVTVAMDGSILVGDPGAGRVRRIDLTGIIETYAGTTPGDSGDEGPAYLAQFASIGGIESADNGSIYIVDPSSLFVTGGNRVRAVDMAGIVHPAAGVVDMGGPGILGDGDDALQAGFLTPRDVAVSGDGVFYVTEEANNRVRRVNTLGVINTVAGTGTAGFFGDGGPASGAEIQAPTGIAISPKGDILFCDNGNRRIRRISPPFPDVSLGGFFVPSARGSEVYQFDPDGRHLATLDAYTSSTIYSFQYDGEGRLIGIMDASGNMTLIERDVDGTPLKIVGTFGQETLLSLDVDGYLGSITNPANKTVTMTYSSGGLVTSFEDARMNLSTMTYDIFGRLTCHVSPDLYSHTMTRQEFVDGYDVVHQSALGKTTTFSTRTTDLDERTQTIQGPDGTQLETTTAQDGLTTRTYADGTVLVTERAADPRFGSFAAYPSRYDVTTPSGLSYSSSSDYSVVLETPEDPFSFESHLRTRDINGRVYTETFDATTGTFVSTSPESRSFTVEINALGRPIRYLQPQVNDIRFSYDSVGRMVSVAQGTGVNERVTTMTYDPVTGFLQSIIGEEGRSVTFTRNVVGGILTETHASGAVISFAYDANGNVMQVTPPGRPAHNFTYSLGNLGTQYAPPTAGLSTSETDFAYTLDRDLDLVTRPDGLMIDSVRDPTTGRVTSQTTPDGVTNFSYDPATGLLVGIAVPPSGANLSYTYDGLLLSGTTWSGDVAGSVTRTFNNDFNLATISVNGADAIAYGYDADELLTSAGSMSLTPDPVSGFLTSMTLGTVTETLSYNLFGELASLDVDASGGGLFEMVFSRDKLGRITQIVETIQGVTRVFAYDYLLGDELERVTVDSAEVSLYAYDANGNRLSHTIGGVITVSGSYDDQDRMTSYGSATYAYDAHGDIETKTDGLDVTTYDYDVLGSLKSVALPDGTLVEYVYDGLGRPVGKRVGGSLVQGFLYLDGLNPIVELDGSGSVVNRFAYGSKGHVPDYMIKNGNEYRLVVDHLGSVRLVVDAVTGAVLQRMDYDEFGVIVIDTNPGFQPFGFCGGLYDGLTGLTRYGARDYDAENGRWTTKDPIGFDGGQYNLYLYVGADPVNNIDTTGRGKIKVIVETVKGVRKVVNATIDTVSKMLKNGKNVDFVGPGAKKNAKQSAEKAWGDVKFDPPHGGKSKHPHYQPKNRGRGSNQQRGHANVANSIVVVPGSSLGTDILGDNLLGEVVNFFNPLGDIQDVIDLVSPSEPSGTPKD
jgi:RHS repeat-associated protein